MTHYCTVRVLGDYCTVRVLGIFCESLLHCESASDRAMSVPTGLSRMRGFQLGQPKAKT